MRRLALILLVAVAVVPAAALAARTATGDGAFELRQVNGVVVLSGKGVVWGQMDRGSLRVTNLSPFSGPQPLVSGAERKVTTDDPDVVVYTGADLHFRLTGGKYRFRFRGTGIDLTAVGSGSADLTGLPDLSGETGDYALNGGNWTTVPAFVDRVVQFPSSSQAVPGTTP